MGRCGAEVLLLRPGTGPFSLFVALSTPVVRLVGRAEVEGSLLMRIEAGLLSPGAALGRLPSVPGAEPGLEVLRGRVAPVAVLTGRSKFGS